MSGRYSLGPRRGSVDLRRHAYQTGRVESNDLLGTEHLEACGSSRRHPRLICVRTKGRGEVAGADRIEVLSKVVNQQYGARFAEGSDRLSNLNERHGRRTMSMKR